jgi:hypothetical protein
VLRVIVAAYDVQQAVQQKQVGFELVPGQVLLYNHVPFLVPILWLIAGKSYILSFILWTGLLVVFYGIGTWILTQLIQPGRPFNRLYAASILTFYPLFVSLMNGQDTAFAFLGLCIWLAGVLNEEDHIAGLGLSLTIVRPQLAVLLAVPFLFRRQKVFLWFFASSAMLGLVSIATVGLQGLRGFFDLLLVSTGGEWYGMKEASMVNLVGLMWRVTPGLGGEVIRWAGWGAFFTAIATLCVIWGRTRELQDRHIVLLVVCAVLFSPHLHYHDLTLLLVAFAAALPALVRAGVARPRDTEPVLLACSLVLLVGGLVPALKYNLPYLVMLGLVLSLWLPQKKLFGGHVNKESA